MRIIETADELKNIEKGWVLTIGNFDGVHRGHQKIIETAKHACAENGAIGVAVMTFEPHPVAILHPDKAPGVLTPLELKKRLLEELGVDCLIVLKDSFELLNMSPQDFVDEFLMQTVRPSVVVEGPNFNFGYGRSGNIDTLTELAASRGFEVIQVEPSEIALEGQQDRRHVMCSSSLVRRLIEAGDVEAASEVLGRSYRLVGKTVAGRGVGRQIGFPTANIEPTQQIQPDEGVYAGYVSVADSMESVCADTAKRPAAFSIGRAKTFISDHPLLIEAHLLEDEVEDLADKYLAMDFTARIRGQERFENKEKLADQIAKDCQEVKRILRG